MRIQYYMNHMRSTHTLHTDTKSCKIAKLYLIIFLEPSYLFNHLLYLVVNYCLDASNDMLKHTGYDQIYHSIIILRRISVANYFDARRKKAPRLPFVLKQCGVKICQFS